MHAWVGGRAVGCVYVGSTRATTYLYSMERDCFFFGGIYLNVCI